MDFLTEKTTQELITVPRPYQLIRNNFLALYWDKPLLEVIQIPGLKLREEVNLNQTLGDYLSAGQLKRFTDLTELIKKGKYSQVKDVFRAFKNIIVDRETLVNQASTPLNWVPWELFTAYGKDLQLRKEEVILEQIEKILQGESYLSQAKETFPKGYPRQRSEIIISRQNANPKIQAINEAVANSIDALTEREKIGQFGLGIKQIFSWLEIGKGEIRIYTKRDDNIGLIRARKGYDGQIYLKFEPVDAKDIPASLEQSKTGTLVEICEIEISEKEREHIEASIRERFRYVPETSIYINGEKINGYENIQVVVGQKERKPPEGEVRVKIEGEKIAVFDSGRGMEKKSFFKMFLPRLGKEFSSVSLAEAEKIIEEKGEVLFIRGEEPKICFSRNREVVFSIKLPSEKLGLLDFSLAIELGKVIKVSEGREGFVFDENFSLGLTRLTEKLLKNEEIQDKEKVAFLNTLMVMLDHFAGGELEGSQKGELSLLVAETKKKIKKVAQPYLQSLVSQGKRMIANDQIYQKVEGVDFYIDTFLIGEENDFYQNLERLNFSRLKEVDGVETKHGWRVYLGDLKESLPEDFWQGLTDPEKLEDYKRRIFEMVPVVIDKERRVVIVSRAIWEKVIKEINPPRKQLVLEALQMLVNPAVFTSYEKDDPRVIFLKQPEKEEEMIEQKEEDFNEMRKKLIDQTWGKYSYFFFFQGNYWRIFPATGEIEIYDKGKIGSQLKERARVKELRLMPKHNPYFIETNQGLAFLNGDRAFQNNYLVIINAKTQVKIYPLPSWLTYERYSITRQGEIIFKKEEQIGLYDPQTGKTTILTYLDSQWKDEYFIPQEVEGKIYFATLSGEVYFLDEKNQPKLVGKIELGAGGGFIPHTFLAKEGEVYLIGLHPIAKGKFRQGVYDVIKYDPVIFRLTERGLEEIGRLPKSEDLSIFNAQLINGEKILIQQAFNIDTFDLQSKKSENYRLEVFDYNSENQVKDLAKIIGVIEDVVGEEYDLGPSLWPLANSLVGTKIFQTFRSNSFETNKINPYDQAQLLNFLPILRFGHLKKDLIIGLLQKTFTPEFWQRQTANLNFEQRQELVQRLVANLGVFFQFSQESISQTDLVLALYSDHLTSFLKLSSEEKEKLVQSLDRFAFEERKKFLRLLDLIFSFEGVEKETVLRQFEKIISNEKYFLFFQKELKQLDDNSFFEIGCFDHLEDLPLDYPFRDYLLFLGSETEFLRDNEEEKEIIWQEKEILPDGFPLEKLVCLRKVRGLVTMEEITDFLRQNPDFFSEISLEDTRKEIIQAVSAQAVEPGVFRRELLQNALDAVLADEKERKEITVDFYYRNQRQELVEEISDNGTGILNWLAFFVPGISNKEGKEIINFGFFGSGLFKIFEEADWVEVETKRKEEEGVYGYRVKMMVERDEQGKVLGIKIDHFRKSLFPQEETGTTLRIVRKTQNLVPELEVFIGRRTYLLMGGLAFNQSNRSGGKVNFYFVDENGEKKPVEVKVRNELEYKTSFGEIKILSSNLPSMVTSGGLRMSDLNYPEANYFKYLPSPILKLTTVSRLSLILPPKLPLVIDRSRLAEEERYIEEIRKVILNDILKRVAFMLLGRVEDLTEEEKQWLSAFKQRLPQDLFTNENYYNIFTSNFGKKAFAIAQKINNNQLLDEDEIKFVQNDENLPFILVGIEFTTEDGKKDSLLRRFIYVQKQNLAQKSEDEARKLDNLGVRTEETEVTPAFVQEATAHYFPQAQLISGAYQEIEEKRKATLVHQRLPDKIPEEEKEIVEDLILSLGLTDIKFVPIEKAAGFFYGETIFLFNKLLELDSRSRIETIVHELAHYLEKKELGWRSGYLDRDEEINYPFTHQQDGSFAYYYRLVSLVLINLLIRS